MSEMDKNQLLDALTQAHACIAELESLVAEHKEEKEASQRTLREKDQLFEVVERSKRMFQSVVDATPDWIVAKDRDFRWILANESVAHAFDMTPRETIGKDDLEVGWPEEQVFGNPQKGIRGLRDDDKAVLAGERLHYPQDRVTFVDGSVRIFDTYKLPLYDDAGEVFAALSLSRDITARLQVEEERADLQRLLEMQDQLIQELSAPVIPVMPRLILVPLIGHIDSVRARDLLRTVLQGISKYQARLVILDITSVPFVDTGMALYLDQAVQTARLKGAQTIITGISDAVAETLVELDIDWQHMETASDLQTGLALALQRLGIKLSRET